MKNLKVILSEWRATDVQSIPTGSLREDPALQPRDLTLIRYRDRPRQEQLSEEQIGLFRTHLVGDANVDLEPILAAETKDGLYVVDGHHRLRAYRLAKREGIPARILPIDVKTAVLVSKLVNLDGTKLPLHVEQRREALWQYLAHLTMRGRFKLPKGLSLRILSGQFGPSHETVGVMLKKLSEIDPADYSEAAKDPGTGWPRWKYVKGMHPWHAMQEELTVDQLKQKNAERAAAAISKLLDKLGVEAFGAGVALLLREEQDPERLKDLKELGELLTDPSPDFCEDF